MKYLIFTVLFLWSIHQLHAQANDPTSQKTANTLNRAQVRPHQRVYTSPVPKGDLKGSPYLFDEWKKGLITMNEKDEVYTVDSMRLDGLNQELDVYTEGQVKAISGFLIKKISFVDNYGQIDLINLLNFSFEGTKLKGFGQVLASGKLSLLKRTVFSFKESNYNVALNVGDRSDAIFKKDEYYLLNEKEEMTRIKSKKELQLYFQSNERMQKFLEENKFNVKQEESLIALVNYFNQS